MFTCPARAASILHALVGALCDNRLDGFPCPALPGLNKSLRAMARASTVINACYPLNIAPVEVPRYRAVNEEVGFADISILSVFAIWRYRALSQETPPALSKHACVQSCSIRA